MQRAHSCHPARPGRQAASGLPRRRARAPILLSFAILLGGVAQAGFAQSGTSFGSVGVLPACLSFTTCTAALGSYANAAVVKEVTAISPGYNLPIGLSAGTTIRTDPQTTATAAPLQSGDDPISGPVILTPFAAFSFARAQTDFGTNRGSASTTLGARGIDHQSNGTAAIDIRTSADSQSAWRDVFAFSGNGHFHADIAIDGHSGTSSNSFPSSFQVLAQAALGNWSYELNVWDVSNLVEDPDGFLVPTLVARIQDGGAEQRSSFATLLALDFDFLASASYVVTSRLEVFASNNRSVDLYHTVGLRDVVVGNGATLSALSGHDYMASVTAPVPEPSTWLLMLAGLASIGRLGRRRQRTT